MKLGKWSYEAIIVLVLIVIGLGIWWYVDNAPQRKADSKIEVMIKFAQKQALEIAIIEQASKLENYKQQIAKNRRAVDAELRSQTPNPVLPTITDPKDVE